MSSIHQAWTAVCARANDLNVCVFWTRKGGIRFRRFCVTRRRPISSGLSSPLRLIKAKPPPLHAHERAQDCTREPFKVLGPEPNSDRAAGFTRRSGGSSSFCSAGEQLLLWRQSDKKLLAPPPLQQPPSFHA